MTDAPKPKSKGGRPKKPPTPPVLGVALRQADGCTVNVVLAGLVVSGKKWEPQAGAELLAEMLLDVLRGRVRLGAAPAPIADYGDSGHEDPPSPELALAPGENGNH